MIVLLFTAIVIVLNTAIIAIACCCFGKPKKKPKDRRQKKKVPKKKQQADIQQNVGTDQPRKSSPFIRPMPKIIQPPTQSMPQKNDGRMDLQQFDGSNANAQDNQQANDQSNKLIAPMPKVTETAPADALEYITLANLNDDEIFGPR
jgi:hypothetical protein